MRAVRSRNLLDTAIAVTDYEQAMDEMERMIARPVPGYVCAVPVHSLMVARHDAGMRSALNGAAMNVPDGRPLVWALNLLGERLRDRVYGPDLMDRFCARAVRRGHRVWLYGGATAQALDDLVTALERRHPGLVVAGCWSPPHRALTAAEEQEVAERIDADAPDVLTRERDHERRVVAQVPGEQAGRLLREAEQPLEAAGLHPAGRLALAA